MHGDSPYDDLEILEEMEANDTVLCDHCGNDVWFDDAQLIDNKYICNCCLDKKYVKCKLCHQYTLAKTAHRHQEEYVGECCWDERLRTTE